MLFLLVLFNVNDCQIFFRYPAKAFKLSYCELVMYIYHQINGETLQISVENFMLPYLCNPANTDILFIGHNVKASYV